MRSACGSTARCLLYLSHVQLRVIPTKQLPRRHVRHPEFSNYFFYSPSIQSRRDYGIFAGPLATSTASVSAKALMLRTGGFQGSWAESGCDYGPKIGNRRCRRPASMASTSSPSVPLLMNTQRPPKGETPAAICCRPTLRGHLQAIGRACRLGLQQSAWT